MIALFLAGTVAALTQTAPEPQPITIGEQYTLEAVDAERSVNIVLPPDYDADPERRWPVV